MLFELPTADEIDSLAITTPKFEVRKFEIDLTGEPADLEYTPCKGQLMLVIRGKKGIVLTRPSKQSKWCLPTGRIGSNEEVRTAAKRIAKDQCGIAIRSLDLAAMYDVVWHYSDITIKRLHLVYAATTDDDECPAGGSRGCESMFFIDLPVDLLQDDISSCAVTDCNSK